MDNHHTRGIFMEKLRIGVLFAEKYHSGQVRRFTGEPFVEHPKRVADHMYRLGYGTRDQLKALLHDVVEDTAATLEDVNSRFGEEVALSVFRLTNPQVITPIPGLTKMEVLSRYGKNMEGGTSVDHTIKLCDIIDNVPSMCRYAGREKAISYIFEKRLFLNYLDKGLPQLIQKVAKMLEKHEKQLMNNK